MTTHDTHAMPGMDDYHTSMNELHFSDEAKARMAARLADASTKERPMSTSTTTARRKRLPLAAAVATIALVLGLGGAAYATGSLVSVERFVSHLFGAKEANVEIVDKVGRPVGVVQSSNGVTVSADAIIGDKTNVAVIFSISKDDGSAFEGVKADDDGFLPLGFSDDFEIDFPLIAQITQGYGATGSAYFYDADPTDNAIQLVETRSFESDGNGEISLIGRTLTAHFSTLKLYGEGDPIVLADGSWNLSFPLNYEDASITLPTGQNFEVSGIPATIDELAISPIALHLRYTAHQKVAWTSGESGRMSEHDTKLTDSLLGTEVTLTMANSTTVAVENNHGGHISENGEVAECDTNIFFDRILDLDEVASITIGGTTIEL